MNLIAGIIVAVVGLLVLVLGISKIVPGVTGTGVSLILLGALIAGLSFVPKPATDDAQRMSTPSTLVNIFFSPTEVFQNLRRFPRWLVALLQRGGTLADERRAQPVLAAMRCAACAIPVGLNRVAAPYGLQERLRCRPRLFLPSLAPRPTLCAHPFQPRPEKA